MSKRFTDTEKWKDEWFLELDNNHRIVWQYLVDNCTNAGRWKKNIKHLNFCCNVELALKELLDLLGDRAVDYPSFIFIPKFLKYQYGRGLNSNKPIMLSVREELKQYSLSSLVYEMYGEEFLKPEEAVKKEPKPATSTQMPAERPPERTRTAPKATEPTKDEQYPHLEDKGFKGAFTAFLEMRSKLKFPATGHAQELILNLLKKYDLPTATAMLEQSIINSYRGVFPLKTPLSTLSIKKYIHEKIPERPEITAEGSKEIRKLIEGIKK